MLKYENAQRWFSLSFKRGKLPAIRVVIYEPNVTKLSELFGIHAEAPDLKEQWGFKSYEPDLRRGFGFDGALTHIGLRNGYRVLEAPLLQGSNGHPLAVSFGLLLRTLAWFPELFPQDYRGDPHHLQLMTLESCVSSYRSRLSAPLGGTASPALAEWVERIYAGQDRLVEVEVERAMWLAWKATGIFLPEKRRRKGPNPYPGFEAHLGEKGSFFIDCLGASVLTIDWWTREEREGHELSCHNLDSPVQQLSLLAGLAALYDLARKDLDTQPPTP